MAISSRDRDILDFEREWWTRPGSKVGAIRDVLGLSPTAYYRAVAALLDSEEAMAYDPLTVRRLRRRREERRRVRLEGRRADPGRR